MMDSPLKLVPPAIYNTFMLLHYKHKQNSDKGCLVNISRQRDD